MKIFGYILLVFFALRFLVFLFDDKTFDIDSVIIATYVALTLFLP